MQDINQEFKDAINLYNDNDKRFQPLIEKFEELKKVLESNFVVKYKKIRWYGKSELVTRPALTVQIETKIDHSTGKYLFIRINGLGYVMGIGEYGDLKDRLYFCIGNSFPPSKKRTFVHMTCDIFHSTEYYLEHKITLVQLFSSLIKSYKEHLVQGT
jgi:hypothetical protein